MSIGVRLKTGAVLAALTVPLAAACSSGSSTSSAPPAAAPTSAPPSSAAAAGTTVKTGTSSLGTILTDSTGKTVYLWEHDPGTSSTCYGACAAFWPPVLTTGAPVAGTGIQASLLGTTTRTDGRIQITYGGHPLYYFVQDKNTGDITGEESNNFGAKWYIVGTNGKKVEKPGA